MPVTGMDPALQPTTVYPHPSPADSIRPGEFHLFVLYWTNEMRSVALDRGRAEAARQCRNCESTTRVTLSEDQRVWVFEISQTQGCCDRIWSTFNAIVGSDSAVVVPACDRRPAAD